MQTLEILRKNDLKATWQRVAVYESLKAKGHSTAEDIYKALAKKMPSLSLATVYSILRLFSQKGIIDEMKISNEKAYFDITTSFHHHFICTTCGKILDLDIPACGVLKTKNAQGNKIEKFSGVFYGVCKKCLKERSKI